MGKLLGQGRKASKWQSWEPRARLSSSFCIIGNRCFSYALRIHYYKIDAFSSDNFMTNKSKYKQSQNFKVCVNYILHVNILIIFKELINYESYLLTCQRIRMKRSKFQTSKLIFLNHIKSSWRFLPIKSPCYKVFRNFLKKMTPLTIYDLGPEEHGASQHLEFYVLRSECAIARRLPSL